MASMGYCRFENTMIDARECYEELQEKGILGTYAARNEYERPNIKAFIEMCIDVAEEFQEEFEELTDEDYKEAAERGYEE